MCVSTEPFFVVCLLHRTAGSRVLFTGSLFCPVQLGYTLVVDELSAIFPVPFLVYGREKR